MRVVADMNLSPDWVALLRRAGFDAQHWSRIANPRALDPEIMEWARQHDAVVLTHDLDFGATLALTHARGTKCHSNAIGKYFARGRREFCDLGVACL